MKVTHVYDPVGDVRDVLAEICVETATLLADHPDLRFPDGVAPRKVLMVLGGVTECKHWGVPKDSVGFHAVCSPRRRGDKYDVPDDHAFVVNLDEAVDYLGGRVSDPMFDCDVESWLVTIPHELLHVIEWMAATGGLVPGEVFDNGGVYAIRDVHAKIEAATHGDREDAAEGKARSIIDKVVSPLSIGFAKRLVEAFRRDREKEPIMAGTGL